MLLFLVFECIVLRYKCNLTIALDKNGRFEYIFARPSHIYVNI